MKPKHSENVTLQDDLFKTKLVNFLNLKHTLIQLADQMDWGFFEQEFGLTYAENLGRPGLPTRLMVGMTYLKHLYDLSDEDCVEMFLESGYWQYFCGYEFFQKEFPCDSSSLTRFRARLGEDGVKKLFQSTLKMAQKLGFIRASDCEMVIVDTTVQEKNITFPTDSKLLNKMRENLVRAASDENIKLRQSYAIVGKLQVQKAAGYAHAKQYKRLRKSVKKLRTYLGRVIRDIDRKCAGKQSEKLNEMLELARKLVVQEKDSKKKIYSIHEPAVDCISKGKAHKKYEFGCKVGLIVTAKKNWILGAHAMHGNPFDGKTLKESIKTAEENSGVKVTDAFVDKGYRGTEHHPEAVGIHISGKQRLDATRKKLLKRRSAIEPIIGHVKHDHRMNRSLLKGVIGDKQNALLAAGAFNLRKIMRAMHACVEILLKKLVQEILIKALTA